MNAGSAPRDTALLGTLVVATAVPAVGPAMTGRWSSPASPPESLSESPRSMNAGSAPRDTTLFGTLVGANDAALTGPLDFAALLRGVDNAWRPDRRSSSLESVSSPSHQLAIAARDIAWAALKPAGASAALQLSPARGERGEVLGVVAAELLVDISTGSMGSSRPTPSESESACSVNGGSTPRDSLDRPTAWWS